MTARDEMAALVSGDPHTPLQGVDKWYLDAIASLAANPETAPVVFRWLVEAGVLRVPDLTTQCHHGTSRFGWTSGKNPAPYLMPCVLCSIDAIEAAPEEAAPSEGHSPFAVGDTEPSSP